MKRTLIVPLALLFLAGSAVASSVCTLAGLDVYVASYNGQNNACQIGNMFFYDFAYIASYDAGAAPLASQIRIRPDAANPITNPGLIISSGAFSIFSGMLDATITYSVATVSGSALLEDYSLLIAGSHPGSLPGYGIVTASFSNLEGSPLVTSFGPGDSSVTSAHVAFTPFIPGTTVTTRLQESSGVGDFVTISAIQEHFSEQIPEPYAAVLLGSGLVLLGLRRKRVA